MTSESNQDSMIVVGVIIGPQGVLGAVKLKSYCEPPEQIFKYKPWTLVRATDVRSVVPIKLRGAGGQLVARLPDMETREHAEAMKGFEIRVLRSQLPKPAAGEYYWHDLIGLRVVGIDGFEFGSITAMLETGSNDVMQVKGERERLLPFTPGVHVIDVDLQTRTVKVDWDPEF
jgi:16S rRNA processing protein RimM